MVRALSPSTGATPSSAGADACAGGLLVDFGVLQLKPGALGAEFYAAGGDIPRLSPSHPAIVEWRALTVIELCVSFPLRHWDSND
jgi:hypothetical protein